MKSDQKTQLIKNFFEFAKICRTALCENAKWTYRYEEIFSLFNFALNEKLFVVEEIRKSKEIHKFIKETWEIGKKSWLLQRGIVNKLFLVLSENIWVLGDFGDIIFLLIKAKVNY